MKSVIKVIGLIFLAVIVGFGTYKITDKLDPKVSPCNCDCNNNNVTDSTSDFYANMKKNRKMIQDNSNYITIVMDELGNVYWGVDEYRGDTVSIPVGVKGQYEIKDYEGHSPEGMLTNILYGYKLDVKDAISIHNVSYGNGGYRAYIIIKSDGTIARLSYLADNYDNKVKVDDIKFEGTVSGYTNIAGVINHSNYSASGYDLYDINGNIIKGQ